MTLLYSQKKTWRMRRQCCPPPRHLQPPPSSFIQTTIPLVIKSESKVPPYKAEDLDSIMSYTDQKQTTSLYCVEKQLYASELVVVNTIYCPYKPCLPTQPVRWNVETPAPDQVPQNKGNQRHNVT